ncbi:hypothetical protein, partial [Candidatus Clavichlamydia salmonicola]|uniref:hypothetical protein n=1 Tax=Candidatus Clavichlamydia salmonicola TaxID=469812 RepID=UPI0018916EBA
SLPINDQEVFLCFTKADHLKASGVSTFVPWSSKNFGICQNQTSKDTNDEINCVKVSDYMKQYPQIPVPHCVPMSKEAYRQLGSFLKADFLGGVFMYYDTEVWRISQQIVCMMESVFHTMGLSMETKRALGKSRFCQPSTKVRYRYVNNQNQQINADVMCWEKTHNITEQHPQAFIPVEQCVNPSLTTTPLPYTTLASSVSSFTTTMPVVESNCPTCSYMILAFGVGSAIILMATLGKIIYKQCTFQGLKKPKGGSRKCRRLADLIIEEGLLLGASGLGTGLLVTSLLSPCRPVDESTKKIVMASTA